MSEKERRIRRKLCRNEERLKKRWKPCGASFAD